MKYLGIIVFSLLVGCTQSQQKIELKGWGDRLFEVLEDRKNAEKSEIKVGDKI
jgi:hypothetical protein